VISHDTSLRVRRATADDCRLLWEWANDPGVREAAFNSDTISWARHVEWFEARLRSPDTVIYVMETGERAPVGQVRFDWRAADAVEIDISVAAQWRGHGLGAEGLRLACDAFHRGARATIVARIRTENRASVRTFEKAGFEHSGTERVGAHDVVRMELRRKVSPAGQ
jgi:RimJ/RimL family protein N-acetyltransferase